MAVITEPWLENITGDWFRRCKIGVRGLPLGQRIDCKKKEEVCISVRVIQACMNKCVHISLCTMLFLCFNRLILFLLDPRFVGVYLIPESDNPEDDKIFLFFKENAMDGEHTGKATISRIGQLCKVTTHTRNPYPSLLLRCIIIFHILQK